MQLFNKSKLDCIVYTYYFRYMSNLFVILHQFINSKFQLKVSDGEFNGKRRAFMYFSDYDCIPEI